MSDKKGELLVPEQAAKITKEIEVGAGGVVLKTVEDAVNFAKWNVESGLLPEHINTAKKAFAIMARGAEMGLKPHASWRWIYMTKGGKMAMESKGKLAVCQASPVFTGYREWVQDEDGPVEGWKAVAVAKRKGREDIIKEFSYKDAERAHLVQKKRNRKGELYDGTYQLYLKDMLLARARDRALDLQFADVLGGMPAREIMEDVEEAEPPRVSRETPTVTVEDPLMAAAGVGQPKDPETQEVIDAQVDEVFDAKDLGGTVVDAEMPAEVEITDPGVPPKKDDILRQMCRGCGAIYGHESKGCPECGLASGQDPSPPPDEKEGVEAEAKHQREKMKAVKPLEEPDEDAKAKFKAEMAEVKKKARAAKEAQEPENPFERGRAKARAMKKGQQELPKE